MSELCCNDLRFSCKFKFSSTVLYINANCIFFVLISIKEEKIREASEGTTDYNCNNASIIIKL